jgi:hypothetical protein
MSTSPTLISFRGLIGSGKTFSANRAVETHGFQRIAFADALKLEVFDALWYREFPVVDEVTGPILDAVMSFKQVYPDEYFRPLSLYYINDKDKLDFINANKVVLRPLLQWWGTEYRRGQNENYWLDQWYEKVSAILKAGGKVVVDDARFDNEFQAIDHLDGTHVYISASDELRKKLVHSRDGAVNLGIAQHASEQSASVYTGDEPGFHLTNDGGPAFLESLDLTIEVLSAQPSF